MALLAVVCDSLCCCGVKLVWWHHLSHRLKPAEKPVAPSNPFRKLCWVIGINNKFEVGVFLTVEPSVTESGRFARGQTAADSGSRRWSCVGCCL